MAQVPASVERLFVPQKGNDKRNPSGVYDDMSRRHLESRISSRLSIYLADPSTNRSPIAKKLGRTCATSRYPTLVSTLAEAAIYYTTERVDEGADESKLIGKVFATTGKRGSPPRHEVPILLHDVREAISAAIGKDVGTWQRDNELSPVVIIAKLVAASVGKPLAQNSWRQIEKARRTRKL